MRVQSLLAWLVGLSLILAVTACQKEKPVPQQRYEVRGKVVAVDKRGGTVTLAHEAIQGYMGAMTMGFVLKDQWAFDVLKEGQSVRATLVVQGENAWLEGIVVTEEPTPASASLASPEALPPPPLGAEVPDFQLINQDGKRIHLHQYRGKALLLTFIYTRCPLPNYCPLMSRNFAKILDELRRDPSLAASTHLLSVSIDPEYDTPAILRSYGLEWAGKSPGDLFKQWEFASGAPEQVRKVAGFFGASYWTDRGQIVHLLVTALVGPDGKVRKLYPGNQWQPADVLSDLRSLPRGRG
ncbi:MAG: SCO family protein [Terriglobia bacterium]|jgi:protein SCO1/2